jgi:hypothetical protein
MRFACLAALFAASACVVVARGEEMSLDGRWFAIDALPAEVEAQTPWIRPGKGQQVLLDVVAMRQTLASAPLETSRQVPIIVWLPKPDGTFERFRVVESPIMMPDLAAQLPDVKTYAGQGLDDAFASVRFDMTPAGFHAQVLSVNGAYYIDPSTQGNVDYYTSYYKRDYTREIGSAWRCLVGADAGQLEQPGGGFQTRVVLSLNTVRLAVAATAEFTAYHSLPADTDAVKKSKAQVAITTLINRVNGIYENELQTRLLLVNNTNIIYTDSATDPYTDSNVNQMISANQTNVTTVVGSANFDVGHVVGRTGSGGVAGLGVVCSAGNKARGVSCFDPPVGDPFAVDYIAHELGHQFSGQHSFAGCNGNAGTTSWRYEPGSGSTVMAYAGICGADNLQSNSDPFFHHENIQGMRTFISGLTCDGALVTTNNIPTITAPGLTYVIPQQTPFALTVTSAADADGDALTYSWEQSDSATAAGAVALSQGDLGTNPIFRARAPVASATRFFPALDDVIDGTRDAGEFLPQAARTLSFRATVRDNRSGGGGVAIQPSGAGAETRVTINTASGPFTVTNPTGNPLLNGGASFTLTWNVASSNVAPVNCANVDVLLSSDGGLTFPTVVLANTPNDGTQAVTIPGVSTNTARFMVRAVGNVFFNVSPSFRINVAAPATPTNVTATPNPACAGQSVSLSATVGSGEVVDWFRTSCGGTLVGTGHPLVVPTPLVGTYFARARRTSDNVSSAVCGTVVVAINTTPAAATSVTVDRNNFCSDDSGNITLTASGGGGSGATLRWFADACGSTSIGTGTSIVIASPAASTQYFCRWENLCGNSLCASVAVNVNAAPSPPTLASVNRNNFCSDDAGSITLSATAGSGTTLRWFAGSCGSASIGTGTSLVIASPTASTTYFCRWESACGNTTCASVNVNVNAATSPPTTVAVDRSTFCAVDDGQIMLSASGGSGTYEWFADSCGSSVIGTSASLTIASPVVSTTYFVRTTGACGPSACLSVSVTTGRGNVDFNNNGVFPEDQDVIDFFDVIAGGVCPTCDSIDFNGDGIFPDDRDVTDLFAVLAGGSC